MATKANTLVVIRTNILEATSTPDMEERITNREQKTTTREQNITTREQNTTTEATSTIKSTLTL